MKPILFSLFDNMSLVKKIPQGCFEIGNLILRQFPDEETYIKINSAVKDRKVILMVSLDRPNAKLLPLLLVCETVKDLGATEVGLLAPYLAYMRQDKRFNPGEGITAKYFATLLSQYFDWMITIDPHLHRIKKLDEVYTIPSFVLHAVDPISSWIKNEIENPIIIGPDKESEQWISSIAKNINAPYIVAEKIRKGDREVEIVIPDLEKYRDKTFVLVDDIIATAKTMMETIQHLKKQAMKPPVCIGIHGIFSGNSYEELIKSGVRTIVTCDTVKHVSNAITVGPLLGDQLKKLRAFI